VVNGSPTCSGNQCGMTCLPGFAQCGSICVDTTSDLDHCGGCDKPCPTGQVCAAGKCESDCPANTTDCGACVNTSTDPSNCQGCGKACPNVENGDAVCGPAGCGQAELQPDL
jgi:hypothetical protein